MLMFTFFIYLISLAYLFTLQFYAACGSHSHSNEILVSEFELRVKKWNFFSLGLHRWSLSASLNNVEFLCRPNENIKVPSVNADSLKLLCFFLGWHGRWEHAQRQIFMNYKILSGESRHEIPVVERNSFTTLMLTQFKWLPCSGSCRWLSAILDISLKSCNDWFNYYGSLIIIILLQHFLAASASLLMANINSTSGFSKFTD